MTKRKNHWPDFEAKVGLEAIREEMTLAELWNKYGVHPTQIGTWKRAAIKNMAAGFSKRGGYPVQVDDAAIDKLHSKVGLLVVARDFLKRALGSLSKDRRQMCIEKSH